MMDCNGADRMSCSSTYLSSPLGSENEHVTKKTSWLTLEGELNHNKQECKMFPNNNHDLGRSRNLPRGFLPLTGSQKITRGQQQDRLAQIHRTPCKAGGLWMCFTPCFCQACALVALSESLPFRGEGHQDSEPISSTPVDSQEAKENVS